MKDRLEALAYDVVTGFMRMLPFRAVSRIGACAVGLIGPLTSKKHIAETGLRTAFPDKSDAEIQRLMRAQWDNLGRTFAEFPLTHRLRPFDKNSRITIQGIAHFEANRPAIIVGGHFANWEVMATVLTQSDHTVHITYRKINNPLIDARVRSQREAYGTKFLVKKSTHAGGRELFEALKAGESVALLNDQKFNTVVLGSQTLAQSFIQERHMSVLKSAAAANHQHIARLEPKSALCLGHGNSELDGERRQ